MSEIDMLRPPSEFDARRLFLEQFNDKSDREVLLANMAMLYDMQMEMFAVKTFLATLPERIPEMLKDAPPMVRMLFGGFGKS